MLVLRIVHIFSGVCWVGGIVVLVGFIEPTANATAPASAAFMQHLMFRRRFSQFMTVVPILTVLAGSLMYWRDSAGLNLIWITTPTGMVFTIGAVLGFTTLAVGLLGIKPRADRLGVLAQEIATAGKPTPAQAAQAGALNTSMARLTRILLYLLTVVVICMATARYI